MKCDLCGKSAMFGERISHSKHHTNRKMMPNIHAATVVIEGETKHLNLCIRCLRTQNKAKAE